MLAAASGRADVHIGKPLLSRRSSQPGVLRDSPRSAPVCFNTPLFPELLPRGLHLPVQQTQGPGAGDTYVSAGTAGGQHPDRVHWRSANPRFPAGLCVVAYPSALITTHAAAALGFLDGSPIPGRLAGPFPAAGAGMLRDGRPPGRSTGHGQQALPGHSVGPGVEQSRRSVKHRRGFAWCLWRFWFEKRSPKSP